MKPEQGPSTMGMKRTAALLVLCAAVSSAGAPGLAQSLDDRVKDFLAAQKDRWREENVSETGGRFLHDLILERGYTRALEIGTSTGHSGIWQAWALSKTGGSLVTVEIQEFRQCQEKRRKSAGRRTCRSS
jgi:caffeoyl-CoA O-methyltransferase